MTAPATALVEALFCIVPTSPADVFVGVHDPDDRWNTWANPRFDRTEAERVIAAITGNEERGGLHDSERTFFEWDGDVLLVTEMQFVEEGETPQAWRLEPTDGRYQIGNYAWCWTEVADEDMCHDGNRAAYARVFAYAAKVQAALIADATANIIPGYLVDFSSLHDHVDANDYLRVAGVPAPSTSELDLTVAVQDVVDDWLAMGGLRAALDAQPKPKPAAPVRVAEPMPSTVEQRAVCRTCGGDIVRYGDGAWHHRASSKEACPPPGASANEADAH
jgi:hypothetical protein